MVLCVLSVSLVLTKFDACSNVIVKGVTILARIPSPNTDGIDPGLFAQSDFYFATKRYSQMGVFGCTPEIAIS